MVGRFNHTIQSRQHHSHLLTHLSVHLFSRQCLWLHIAGNRFIGCLSCMWRVSHELWSLVIAKTFTFVFFATLWGHRKVGACRCSPCRPLNPSTFNINGGMFAQCEQEFGERRGASSPSLSLASSLEASNILERCASNPGILSSSEDDEKEFTHSS